MFFSMFSGFYTNHWISNPVRTEGFPVILFWEKEIGSGGRKDREKLTSIVHFQEPQIDQKSGEQVGSIKESLC